MKRVRFIALIIICLIAFDATGKKEKQQPVIIKNMGRTVIAVNDKATLLETDTFWKRGNETYLNPVVFHECVSSMT